IFDSLQDDETRISLDRMDVARFLEVHAALVLICELVLIAIICLTTGPKYEQDLNRGFLHICIILGSIIDIKNKNNPWLHQSDNCSFIRCTIKNLPVSMPMNKFAAFKQPHVFCLMALASHKLKSGIVFFFLCHNFLTISEFRSSISAPNCFWILIAYLVQMEFKGWAHSIIQESTLEKISVGIISSEINMFEEYASFLHCLPYCMRTIDLFHQEGFKREIKNSWMNETSVIKWKLSSCCYHDVILPYDATIPFMSNAFSRNLKHIYSVYSVDPHQYNT
ncbi:hypothetical protein ACJX0J_029655, partial [Zea mays]